MHYCNNCGKKIKNNVEFCPYCGSKQTDVKVSVSPHRNVGSSRFVRRPVRKRHHRKLLWSVIVIILVVLAGFGFYKHKEDTDLANILTSHSWSVTAISTDNNEKDTPDRETFKNNKIRSHGHVFGSYHVTSQNQINMYIPRAHAHLYNHVKSANSKKIVVNKEQVQFTPSYAKMLKHRYESAPEKPRMNSEESKMLNGQVVTAHETSVYKK